MEFLEIIKMKRRIINIDESNFDLNDYRRQVWAEVGNCQSIRVKKIQPKVSLIMAIDNHGAVYSSMTTVNTDTRMMCLYIRELTKILEKEDKKFRSYTLLIHDGAAYAK